jgi:hypothetical protein
LSVLLFGFGFQIFQKRMFKDSPTIVCGCLDDRIIIIIIIDLIVVDFIVVDLIIV